METYIHGHQESVLTIHRARNVSNSAPYLLDLLDGIESVLDVGCGPGSITKDFVDSFPHLSVVGVDQDPTVLINAKMEHSTKRVSFAVGSAYQLPCDDKSFDLVHAHQVLQHVKDPQRIVREMMRVSRQYVAFADADYEAMFWWPLNDGLSRWMEIYQQIAKANEVDPNIGRKLPELIRSMGAVQVQVSTYAFAHTTQEQCIWWGDAWSERVLTSNYAHEAIRLNLSTRQELEEISNSWKLWARAQGAIFIVTNVGVLATMT